MKGTLHLESSRIVVATALALLPIGCTHPRTDGPGAAAADHVVVRGTVVGGRRAAPLEGASVSLLWSDSDSLLTTTSTARGGTFEVRAPRARFNVLARRVGFAARRQSLDLASQSGDTVALTIHLEYWNLALEEQIAELQRPTEVTPCRPANSTALRVAELIRDMLAPEDSTILRQVGVGDLAGVSVEHVIDRDLCRAATDAMGRAHEIPGEGMQVHLYRLGDRGWAAYEASFIGSHYSSLYLLDRELTRVREIFAF